MKTSNFLEPLEAKFAPSSRLVTRLTSIISTQPARPDFSRLIPSVPVQPAAAAPASIIHGSYCFNPL